MWYHSTDMHVSIKVSIKQRSMSRYVQINLFLLLKMGQFVSLKGIIVTTKTPVPKGPMTSLRQKFSIGGEEIQK